jgi:hypothetical protein
MDIVNIVEKMLEETGRRQKRNNASGLCNIAGCVMILTGDDEFNAFGAFCDLMKEEFLRQNSKSPTGLYWWKATSAPDNIVEWYAPRIEFLKKWLENLNNK